MYQKHSETSREAYKTLEGSKEAAEKIFKLVESRGIAGISAPWIAEALDMIPGTVAARVIGLERDQRIFKLERTEKSPRGKPANIIIAAKYRKESLIQGEKILLTKQDESGEAINAEMAEVLKEVENLVALGSPILYGSELHKRIQRLAK